MGMHKKPMLDKAIAMAFNSGDFAAAWRACGKPGTWRNADRQWKATMKKQQEQQQASAAQQQEQAAAAHQTPLHGKAPAAASTRTAASTGAPTQGRTGELKAPAIRHSSAQTAKIKASSDAALDVTRRATKESEERERERRRGQVPYSTRDRLRVLSSCLTMTCPMNCMHICMHCTLGGHILCGVRMSMRTRV